MKKWLIIFAALLLLIAGCDTQENITIVGGEVIENPFGETVIITGTIATLTLSATYNVGVAVVKVSLTNTTEGIIFPQEAHPILQPYCYKVTVKDSSGNDLSAATFGTGEFEEQFDALYLLPDITYSEYEYVFPWELPNDPFGGKMRTDVWLSEMANPDTIYHMWGEVNLAIEWF